LKTKTKISKPSKLKDNVAPFSSEKSIIKFKKYTFLLTSGDEIREAHNEDTKYSHSSARKQK
jgi:hypothetical protein